MLKFPGPEKPASVAHYPDSFFDEIGAALLEHYFSWNGGEAHLKTEAGAHAFCMNQYYRMGQALDLVIPWVESAVPLSGRRILEIGCGTGSSTFGIATRAERVRAIDIKHSAVEVAKRRIEAGRKVSQLCNVEVRAVPADWLDPVKSFDWDGLFRDGIDSVFLYAVLEHLTPVERIHILREIWKRLPPNGILITYETPNRLAVFDWHTSKLPFADILPDELTALYYRKSPRKGFPKQVIASDVDDLSTVSRLASFRFGRGASFHEFDIAIGLDSMNVLADGYSNSAGKRRYKEYGDYEASLASVLASLDPPVPRGFAFPSLDLVIAKRSSS